MKAPDDITLPDSEPPSPAHSEVIRSALQCLAQEGHFDELRGRLVPHCSTTAPSPSPFPSLAQSASQWQGQSSGLGRFWNSPQEQSQTNPAPDDQQLSALWRQFFEQSDALSLADLDQRAASLQRQVRDNGVTYNVYADEEGPQRPWSLDLFPLIIDSAQWQHIEAGVQQRMRLLEAVMADVYGEQNFLKSSLLPAALVHGHPGYLRPMHGVQPAGGVYLHVAAFDLARGPDGKWWVVGQRSQAPSGLGYLLENRLAVSRQFPQAFQTMRVQRLAATYRALMNSLKAMSPQGEQAHLALLTPGPYNETYFEHAYLARYLGLTLVEGSDLIVRDERLYLRALHGLVPIHGLLKRVDDQYLDPLELRADSTLGVPGLLQAIRAGHVLVANAPGSAFLESPALLGFLPALARYALGEELLMPALPTWWCGERIAMHDVLTHLRENTIKATYPGSPIHEGFDAALTHRMGQTELDALAARIMRKSEEHTVQTYMPLSQIPTWQSGNETATGRMVARSCLLRVFAVSDGIRSDGQPRWRVLPGGLARVAGTVTDIASMQRGGSSADVWVLTDGEVDTTTLLPNRLTAANLAHRKRLVTSRAAENLYWLGRYTERAENTNRLARITLEALGGEEQTSAPLMQWLTGMAVANALVLPTVAFTVATRRAFERTLITQLGSSHEVTSVGYNLRAIKLAAAAVRDRLSQDHWNLIVRMEEEFSSRCAEHQQRGDITSLAALRVLKAASDHLSAITGAQTDRMTRDDGWRLLSIGRHVERLSFLATALGRGFESQAIHTEGGFEGMLSLFDSTITFRAQYQQSRDIAALCDLLVLDRDNPRSLAWVVHTLRARLAKLANIPSGESSGLLLRVPNPNHWDLATLCATEPDGEKGNSNPPALMELLGSLKQTAFTVSDEISITYFTHAGDTKQSVGA